MIGKSLFVGSLVEWTALDSEKDAAELSKWTGNLQFSRTLFDKPFRPYAVFEVKKKLKEDLKSADEKRDAYFFAIRKKGTSELVCLLKYGWLRYSHQSARIFLNFSSSESMTEYGREIMEMALRFGFMELSLHRLWTAIPGCNLDEMQLFESSGFLREIQHREAAFFNGQYYDLMIYSLLKPEWKKMKQQEVTQMQPLEVTA